MTDIKNIAEKHKETQKTIFQSFKKAESDAKERVRNDYKKKRRELQDKLEKLKEESNDLLLMVKKTDSQNKAELANLTNKLTEGILAGGQTSPNGNQQELEQRTIEMKKRQIDMIMNEAITEINNVLIKTKEKITQIDSMYSDLRMEKEKQASPKFTYNDLTSIKRLMDDSMGKRNEFIANKERLDNQIADVMRQLSELNLKETEHIKNIDEKSWNDIEQERSREMKHFLDKMSRASPSSRNPRS